MCGIVGFTWRDRDLVSRMMTSVAHRGPDDEPAWWNCKGAGSVGASGEPRPNHADRGRGSTGTARERLPALAFLPAKGWPC